MARADDLRKRLESLNGGPLRYQPTIPPPVERPTTQVERPPVAPIVYRRHLPRTTPAPAPARAPVHPVALEEAVPGVEVATLKHGSAYRITTNVRDLDGDWDPVCEDFLAAFSEEASPLQERLHVRCGGGCLDPEGMLFVDVETTGLSNASPLFLIGALCWEGDDLVVRQYLARHYGEEAAVTALFLEQAADKQLLVSFNGKSFDLPYIRTRAAANGIPFRLRLPHFDLLHESRRIWRGLLPNCRLQTLEQHVCGHPPRSGDIPGMEIPQAYHTFVHTQHPGQLAQIIQHNMLDLVTLAELITKLPPLGV